jgi:cyanophycinase-like exopeptidase
MVNGSWKRIQGTAAGTTTLMDSRSGQFNGIYLGGTSAGTIAMYDTDAGTSAATEIFSRSLVSVGTAPAFLPFSFDVKKGLKVVHTGTSYDFVVVYN